MFNKVTKILTTIALTGWMGVANATLIFDFSWDSSNGRIIGEISGLENNAVGQRATGIVLSSIGGVLVNIDVVNDLGWQVKKNVFHVWKGGINFDFRSYIENPLCGRWPGICPYPLSSEFMVDQSAGYSLFTRNYVYLGGEWRGSNIAFVNRVTVPEPSTVILLSLGLAGLSFARYRKQY